MTTDPALHRRRAGRRLLESAFIAAVGLALAAYVWVPGIRRHLDVVATPAVEGLTMGYSAFSTAVHRKTGLDLGLVKLERDPAFEEQIRVATYVNERRAGPLIDIATDKRVPDERRDAALRTLLKFPSSEDWIQPLLNELPKGGLVGLYQRETPTLDALFHRVREEGGIRQPLIEAYAELVFSFMLQVPDAILRAHGFRWISDALPESALSMIVPRIPAEKNGDVQKTIERALLDVRVIPKPDAAAGALLPLFRNPPWDTLKLPVAVVLARLGDKGAAASLKLIQQERGLTDDEREAVDVALAGTRYPARVDTSQIEELVARRERERREQAQAAVIKRDRLERQERLQQDLLARATGATPAASVSTAPEAAAGPAKPLSMRLPINRSFVVTRETALYLEPGAKRQAFTVPEGTEVHADVQATANGRTWYQITTAAGPRWVDSDALETPEQAKFLSQSAETAELEVADGRVPVYGEASSLSRIVGSLGKGHVVHVLRADKINAEQWFEIQMDRGTSGWIRGDLSLRLKVAPQTPPTVEKTTTTP